MDKQTERNELVMVVQRALVFLYDLMKSGTVTVKGKVLIQDHIRSEIGQEEMEEDVQQGNISES